MWTVWRRMHVLVYTVVVLRCSVCGKQFNQLLAVKLLYCWDDRRGHVMECMT